MAKSQIAQEPFARTYVLRKGLLRLFALLTLAGMAAAGVAGAAIAAEAATETDNQPRLLVAVNDGLLTVDAANVPLSELIPVVGREAGLETVIHGPLVSPFRSWFLWRVPLIEGIHRLAGDNIVAVFAPEGDDMEASRPQLLVIRGTQGNIAKPASKESTSRPGPAAADDADRLATIEKLATALVENADPAARARAARLIADFDGTKAIDAIAAGLGDDDASVREYVITLLGEYDAETATMALGQVVFGEPDAELRRTAVLSLALQQSPAARHIVEAATRDLNGSVREEAVQALAQWN